MIPLAEQVAAAVAALAARGIAGPFEAAIVLGTGLGGFAERIEQAVGVTYADIPHMPRPGVSGHGGRLIAGRLGGRRILVLQGRVHTYEAGDPGAMRVPIGLVAALTPILVLTNAAGAVDPAFSPPACVLLSDHINLTGLNPLVGESDERRFVPMQAAYDPALRAAMRRAADSRSIALPEAVYMWFPGPSFETPAEIRAARALGAGLVGMSTVPEAILARFHGIRVVALSLVTNLAAGLTEAVHTHEDTKDAAAAGASTMSELIAAFVSGLDPV